MEKRQTQVSFIIDARTFDEDKLNLSLLSIINSEYIPELLDDIDIHIVTLPTKVLDMGSTSFLFMLHSNTNIVFHRIEDGEDVKEIALCTCSPAVIFLDLAETYIYKPLLFKHKSESAMDKDVFDIASMIKKSNISKEDWKLLFDNASTIISALKHNYSSAENDNKFCSTVNTDQSRSTVTIAKNTPSTYTDTDAEGWPIRLPEKRTK